MTLLMQFLLQLLVLLRLLWPLLLLHLLLLVVLRAEWPELLQLLRLRLLWRLPLSLQLRPLLLL